MRAEFAWGLGFRRRTKRRRTKRRRKRKKSRRRMGRRRCATLAVVPLSGNLGGNEHGGGKDSSDKGGKGR